MKYISSHHACIPAKKAPKMRTGLREQALADIAHSLQTPLAILKSELFFLKQEHPGNGRALMCDRLIDTVSQSVNAFLHISTLEHALRDEPPADTRLDTVITDVCTHMSPLADIHGITIIREISQPVHVIGVRNKLYELAMNIMSNSIKYMGFGKKREIRVTLSHTSRVARLSIADTGLGIPSSDIPHLYTSLFRGTNGAKNRSIQGSGLGLAIVKKIVDAHHGSIQTKSAPGRGTETVIRIPLAHKH